MNSDTTPASSNHASADAGRRRAFTCELARCGFTEPGFAVAAALFARGPVLRLALAAAAGMSEARTNATLARLEMSQLVQRERDPRDRRVVRLRLTRRGRAQTARALRRCGAGAVNAETLKALSS
ncbi:MAG TPA: MarR family transcriptional regulator [Opitutus sp.]|nr:MarR family transcriptional regulator [Opitutus sp.]